MFFNQKEAYLCVWNTHGLSEPSVGSQKIGKCGVTYLMMVNIRCLLFCNLIRNKELRNYVLENRSGIIISQEFKTISLLIIHKLIDIIILCCKVILSYGIQNSKIKDENWSIELKSHLLQCLSFYTTLNKLQNTVVKKRIWFVNTNTCTWNKNDPEKKCSINPKVGKMDFKCA